MRPVSEKKIKQAVDALRKGRVIVFPTETAYGLGADATNSRAVKRITVIKGKETSKTPPLIVANFSMAERYGIFTPGLRKLSRQFWPGPLTVVVKAKNGSGLSREVIRADGTIAFRVSSNQLAQTLSRRLKAPIVATSANRAGKPPCYDAECVKKMFSSGLGPDLIIDGGKLRGEKPSTIIKEENGKIAVLRRGSIKLPKIQLA